MGDRKQPTPVPADAVKPTPPPAPPARQYDPGFAAAFREWKRRYEENPAAFEREWLALSDGDYGDRAAAYFERLLLETRRSA